MSNYNLEHLEEAYGKSPPEERLLILRYEMLGRITTNRGHARLLKKLLEDNEGDLSKDIKLCVDKIIQSGDEVSAIVRPAWAKLGSESLLWALTRRTTSRNYGRISR